MILSIPNKKRRFLDRSICLIDWTLSRTTPNWYKKKGQREGDSTNRRLLELEQ